MHTHGTRTLGQWTARWGVAVGGKADGFWVVVCEHAEPVQQIVFYFRPSRPAEYVEGYLSDITEAWLDEQAEKAPPDEKETLH
jgi:hypothetical protein